VRNWRKIRELILKVISEEGKFSGDLNFIMANDEFIRKINIDYLKHNWYTDVISFIYDEEEGTNGEIYISIDTVKRNAREYKTGYNIEMLRVIIHGVLHLCGYEDRSSIEKEKMHKKEDFWIMRYLKG
jgi:probable rRNA maturation factor